MGSRDGGYSCHIGVKRSCQELALARDNVERVRHVADVTVRGKIRICGPLRLEHRYISSDLIVVLHRVGGNPRSGNLAHGR